MKRIPKAQYFRQRYQQAIAAGLDQKAAYYADRLAQMDIIADESKTNQPDQIKVDLKGPVLTAMTSAERIKRAVKVWNAPKGTAQQKHSFLLKQGLTGTEVLEALNIAGNGELLNSI